VCQVLCFDPTLILPTNLPTYICIYPPAHSPTYLLIDLLLPHAPALHTHNYYLSTHPSTYPPTHFIFLKGNLFLAMFLIIRYFHNTCSILRFVTFNPEGQGYRLCLYYHLKQSDNSVVESSHNSFPQMHFAVTLCLHPKHQVPRKR
jgi:hypothetical protein